MLHFSKENTDKKALTKYKFSVMMPREHAAMATGILWGELAYRWGYEGDKLHQLCMLFFLIQFLFITSDMAKAINHG